MFDIQVDFDDISISSIEKEDIVYIQKWINDQEGQDDKLFKKPLYIGEFLERFLEYYMSESEFFLKIKEYDKLIGILKGRIEFKNPNEVIIWCFMLDVGFRGDGYGSAILNKTLEYFRKNLGISTFSAGIMDGDNRVLKFWRKNGFVLKRISKNYYEIQGEKLDMLILKRQDGRIRTLV